MNTDLQPVTWNQLAQAFEAWENGYRAEPTNFRTETEVAALPVSQVSAERADYFLELLKVEQAKTAA